MEFKEFKENVENWARVRGIYDESTEAHQQAKALEEIGEYLTAKTDAERMDAIGDIAVCIVNASKLDNSMKPLSIQYDIKDDICDVAYYVVYGSYDLSIGILHDLAINHKFTFQRCLSLAWNEIKDRKGMMVDGKYVKWENLTDEQREEFERRDYANTLIRQ